MSPCRPHQCSLPQQGSSAGAPAGARGRLWSAPTSLTAGTDDQPFRHRHCRRNVEPSPHPPQLAETPDPGNSQGKAPSAEAGEYARAPAGQSHDKPTRTDYTLKYAPSHHREAACWEHPLHTRSRSSAHLPAPTSRPQEPFGADPAAAAALPSLETHRQASSCSSNPYREVRIIRFIVRFVFSNRVFLPHAIVRRRLR